MEEKRYICKPLIKKTDATHSKTEFCGLGASPSVLIKSSPAKSAHSTPKFKCRTPTLNACYTPSSLFRNTACKFTPVNRRKDIQQTSANNTDKRASIATNDDEGRLKVAVRVRPLNAVECMQPYVTNIVRVNGNELKILLGNSADASSAVSHSFVYDHVFYSCDPMSKDYATQQHVFFGTAFPLIERAFGGYNACLFAYGQTGSGKSYSMMGTDSFLIEKCEKSEKVNFLDSDVGIIPRFCHELFKSIKENKKKIDVEVEVSYFEIYNEKIYDLLAVNNDSDSLIKTSTPSNVATHLKCSRTPLKVREHPIWGPYVVNLSVHPINSYEALRNWLIVGNSQRATAAAGFNDKSSRSHSIFNIMLNITELPEIESQTACKYSHQTRQSKICLVDLAGSERISGTNSERMREGVHINKSLLTLGKVISALADEKNSGTVTAFVPYRESVLTWLLRENIGGNSKTVMLATISPANINVDETLATLRYACQARRIVNRVKINESEHDKIIRELRAEVDRLKSLQYEYERQRELSNNTNYTLKKLTASPITANINLKEIENLKEQLAEREKELQYAQKSWIERLRDAENLRECELKLLRRKGLAFELSKDKKQAYLVNLSDDPILSGTLFYILPPGFIKIGRIRTNGHGSQPDIVLDGPLIAHHHCTIENNNHNLYVVPESYDFETYVNGELVTNRKKLLNGDRLVFGGSHFFRVCNPFCENNESKKLLDFQLAYEEILSKQEEKLRLELEEEKRLALLNIEAERIQSEQTLRAQIEQLQLEQLLLKQNKEILESEQRIVSEQNKPMECITNKNLQTTAYKSNFLDKITNILSKPSQESLHKIQLMVKEATQHCKNRGLNYEFKQRQVIDDYGIFYTKVLVIDRELELKMEWPLARLEIWLEAIRNMDCLNSENIFSSVDIDWEPFLESCNDSLNSSRFSVDVSTLKQTLLKHPKDINIANAKEGCFETQATAYIHDIQQIVFNLRRLCEENMTKSSSYSSIAPCILEKLQHLTHHLNMIKAYLDGSITHENLSSKQPR